MFRTALLSIVLSLAVGSNARLLCSAWCHPQAAAASVCHHHPGLPNSPDVADENSCHHVVCSASVFLLEEAWSGGSRPDLGHAIVVPRYQLTSLTTHGRPGHEPRRDWPVENRPLLATLRI